MKNPYGLKNGHPVSVDAVERGLACGCTCPCCGHRLEAHKGAINTHYFAHDDGAECSHAYQTALHILAKEILQEEKRLLLPPLRLYPSEHLGSWLLRKQFMHTVIPPETWVSVDEVRLERAIGDMIPDVLFHVRDRRLMIEIFVTHCVDIEKFRKIKNLGIAAIEFDLSQMGRVVTREDLRSLLVFGRRGQAQCSRKWIFHPDHEKLQKAIDEEFLAKKDMLQEKAKRQGKRLRDEELNRSIQEFARREEERRRRELLF